MDLSTEVRWSDGSYTLEELRTGGTECPLLLKVERGLYGSTENGTIPADQMVLLHKWEVSERVVAVNREGLWLTIPIDHKHKLEVINKKNSFERLGPYDIQEVIKRFKPPVKARFDRTKNVEFYIQNKLHNSRGFGFFELTSVHYMDYAKGSVISADGKINRHTISILPMNVGVEFYLGISMRNYSDDYFSNLLHEVSKSSGPLVHDNSNVYGFSGITECDDGVKTLSRPTTKTRPDSITWGRRAGSKLYTSVTDLSSDDPTATGGRRHTLPDIQEPTQPNKGAADHQAMAIYANHDVSTTRNTRQSHHSDTARGNHEQVPIYENMEGLRRAQEEADGIRHNGKAAGASFNDQGSDDDTAEFSCQVDSEDIESAVGSVNSLSSVAGIRKGGKSQPILPPKDYTSKGKDTIPKTRKPDVSSADVSQRSTPEAIKKGSDSHPSLPPKDYTSKGKDSIPPARKSDVRSTPESIQKGGDSQPFLPPKDYTSKGKDSIPPAKKSDVGSSPVWPGNKAADVRKLQDDSPDEIYQNQAAVSLTRSREPSGIERKEKNDASNSDHQLESPDAIYENQITASSLQQALNARKMQQRDTDTKVSDDPDSADTIYQNQFQSMGRSSGIQQQQNGQAWKGNQKGSTSSLNKKPVPLPKTRKAQLGGRAIPEDQPESLYQNQGHISASSPDISGIAPPAHRSQDDTQDIDTPSGSLRSLNSTSSLSRYRPSELLKGSFTARGTKREPDTESITSNRSADYSSYWHTDDALEDTSKQDMDSNSEKLESRGVTHAAVNQSSVTSSGAGSDNSDSGDILPEGISRRPRSTHTNVVINEGHVRLAAGTDNDDYEETSSTTSSNRSAPTERDDSQPILPPKDYSSKGKDSIPQAAARGSATTSSQVLPDNKISTELVPPIPPRDPIPAARKK